MSKVNLVNLPPSLVPAVDCAPMSILFPSSLFPETASVAIDSHLPFSLLLNPLAGYDRVNAVPFVPVSPSARQKSKIGDKYKGKTYPPQFVRCSDCKSYLNPYMQWDDSTRSWRCSFCGVFNDAPFHFHPRLYYKRRGYKGFDDVPDEDPYTGRRKKQLHHDHYERQRADLELGSIEYEATADFSPTDPAGKDHGGVTLLLIDVSTVARQSGMLERTCRNLRRAIFETSCDEEDDEDLKVCDHKKKFAIVTYCHDAVTVYGFDANRSSPMAVAIPDLTDLFISLSLDEIIVTLGSSTVSTSSQFEEVLNSLPSHYPIQPNLTSVEACARVARDPLGGGGPALGPALLVAARILCSCGGGEVLLTISALPGGRHVTADGGRLDFRDDARLRGTEREIELLQSAHRPIGGAPAGGKDSRNKVGEEKKSTSSFSISLSSSSSASGAAAAASTAPASTAATSKRSESLLKLTKKEKEKEAARRAAKAESVKGGAPSWINRPTEDYSSKGFYEKLAVQFAQMGVFVTTIACSPMFLDLPTLEVFSSETGGRIHVLDQIDLNGEKYEEILESIIKEPFADNEIAYDATIRVRVSKGLRVARIRGPGVTGARKSSHVNFVPQDGSNLLGKTALSDDKMREHLDRAQSAVNVPVLHRKSFFDVDLEFDQFEPSYARGNRAHGLGGTCIVQVTVVYTTSRGQRRIRVHTKEFETSIYAANIAANVQYGPLTALLARRAVATCRTRGPTMARKEINNFCHSFFRSFGKNGDCAGALHVLPKICIGLEKCSAFRGGDGVPPDERFKFFAYFLRCSGEEVINFVLPLLIPLHDTDACADGGGNGANGERTCGPQELLYKLLLGSEELRIGPNSYPVHVFALPRVYLPNVALHGLALPATKASISRGGLYALSNGFTIDIYAAEGADTTVLDSIKRNVIQAPATKLVNKMFLDNHSNDVARVNYVSASNVEVATFFSKLVLDRSNFIGGSFTFDEYVGILCGDDYNSAGGGLGKAGSRKYVMPPPRY